jgi:hypothetical protein
MEISKNTHWLWRGDHEWIITFKNSVDAPKIRVDYTEWPVGIVWADEDAWGSFERLPQTAPPLAGESGENLADPPENAIVIDDQSPAFQLVGAEGVWGEEPSGYAGHFYWIVSNRSTSAAGQWRLEVPVSGTYDIYAYIPQAHASTESARYTIQHAGQQSQVVIDQASHPNTWRHLGNFEFTPTEAAFVSLGSQTEDVERREVAVDAVAFLPGEASEDEIGSDWWQAIERWILSQIEQLQLWIDEIIAEGERSLQGELERLLREFEAWLLAWLQNEFQQFIQEFCGPALMMPLGLVLSAAFVSKRRLRR